jgi:hypothetical protein
LKAISFPFEQRSSILLGTVFRPVAAAHLFSKRFRSWLEVTMLVDTGADYTLLPHAYVEALGINLERECRRISTVGVGGSEVIHFLAGLQIRLGPWPRRIPVGFAQHDAVPALLGRAGCLDSFDVRFAHHRTTFRPLRLA